MKVAVYTAMFGKYDKFLEPRVGNKDFDYYIYTDQKIKTNRYRVMPYQTDEPIRFARTIKIYSGYIDMISKGYDVVIWHDSNMTQQNNLKPLIAKMQTNFMLMKHPTRSCVYDEFHACCDAIPPKDDVPTMFNQVQGYANNGYPEKNGMVATGVMIRKNHKSVLNLCRDWLDEIEAGSYRDQLSFNYVTWMNDFKFEIIPFHDTLTYYFNIRKHLQQ